MFPSHNDGWYGTTLLDQVGLYEIVALRTGNPQLKEILAACYKKVKRTSPEALINGMDLDSCGDKVVLQNHLFPNLGVGVLRSGNKTVVLKAGPSGGLHGHPDKLSISNYSKKCIYNSNNELKSYEEKVKEEINKLNLEIEELKGRIKAMLVKEDEDLDEYELSEEFFNELEKEKIAFDRYFNKKWANVKKAIMKKRKKEAINEVKESRKKRKEK